MSILLTLLVLNFLRLFGALSADSSDIGLSPDKVIENHGYVCEIHYVTTEDGYILAYHRIPHGLNDSATPRPAVLVMHGFTGCSADFIMTGPGRALAFVLADAGYDVWLGNARGNTFSRNHTTLNPDVDNAEFYNFTFHQIGYYDIPNSVDYILNVTGDPSLYYIGHSQGTTAYLVMASTRPKYNDKIRLASLMAPVAIIKDYPSIFIQVLAKYVNQIGDILQKYNINEIPFVEVFRNYGMNECRDTQNLNTVCNIIYEVSFGGDGGQIEKEFLPVISTNNPSNSGLKQLVHFGQLVKNGGFAQYDYGSEEKNMEAYGTKTPPPYDLAKITTPVAFHYGKNDGIIIVEDVKILMAMVPNVADDYLVPYELFKHIDFLYAKDVVKLLYNELISVMQKY